jgi:ATP-dependent Lhr-like helicase
VEAFSVLSPIIRELLEERGFGEPTKTQELSMGPVASGENVLIVAPTGSGKTEAAVLPILDKMLKEGRRPGVRLLYITPLRALNRDLIERLEWWCKRLDLRLAVRHGDTPTVERRRQSLVPPDILITTPETLQILLVGRRLREGLRNVRWVIVDEIHELASDKRGAQLAISLERLRRVTDAEFQRIGLSATIGNAEEVAKFLAGNGRGCRIVRVKVPKAFEYRVIYPQPQEAKGSPIHPAALARMKEILKLLPKGPLLVFTNTRSEAEALASRLRLLSPRAPVSVHHGSLSAERRGMAESGLKAGLLHGVICTSSLELGIDIGTVNLVIQYNSPRQASKLLQRVGRSGHSLTRVSKGVIIAQDGDDVLEAMVLAKRALQDEIEQVTIPHKPLDALAQQLAGLAIEEMVMKLDEALRLVRRSYNYRDLSRAEIEEVVNFLSDKRPPVLRYSEGAFFRPPKLERLYKYYFQSLSMIPEEKQYPVVTEDGQPVGVLDEAFMAEYGEMGTKFVLAGNVWVITQVFKGFVYVRKAEDPLGAIPSWIGEEIPVSEEVALEVGRIRREVEEAAKEGRVEEELRSLLSRYPVGEKDLREGLREVLEQVALGLPVPSDKLLTVEEVDTYVILHTHRGLKANRTLARLLAYDVGRVTGRPIAVKNDPYRIVIEAKGVGVDDVMRSLNSLPNADLYEMIRNACEDTGLFKRRLVQAARKMGVLEKEADITGQEVKLLISTLKGTVVYKEAFRTLLEEDMDVKGVARLLREMAEGRVKVVSLGKLNAPSPLSKIGLEEMARQGELIDPGRMRRLLVESARARIDGCRKTLACLECWTASEVVVGELGDPPTCPNCRSTKVGLVEEEVELVEMILGRMRRKAALPSGLKRLSKKVERSYRLISKYGKAAAEGLCFRVLPNRLNSILARKIGDEFLLALLEEERKLILRRFR